MSKSINSFPQPNSLTPAKINMKPCQNGMLKEFPFPGTHHVQVPKWRPAFLGSLSQGYVGLNLAEISSDTAINIIFIFYYIVCIYIN